MIPPSPATAVFPLLADPDHYVACQWDLTHDPDRRAYWINLYRTNFPSLLDDAFDVELAEGKTQTDIHARINACRLAFNELLDDITANPTKLGRLDIISIGLEREQILRDHQFADPYRLIKQQENQTALAVLPRLLEELDNMSTADRAVALIEGIFAGNIFDVGATETLKLFKQGKIDFHKTRAKLKPRPWLADDLDPWLKRLADKHNPYHAAVLFVDNAGCDVVLGMIPLTRELLQRGTQVIITANSTPSLNDITHTELTDLINTIAQQDAVIADALRTDQLELIPSGNGVPLIDLTQITPQLADAVTRRHVDLVILEGMGRAVESNLEIPFTCDTLKIAMLKDPNVAQSVQGQLYDLLFKFEQTK